MKSDVMRRKISYPCKPKVSGKLLTNVSLEKHTIIVSITDIHQCYRNSRESNYYNCHQQTNSHIFNMLGAWWLKQSCSRHMYTVIPTIMT